MATKTLQARPNGSHRNQDHQYAESDGMTAVATAEPQADDANGGSPDDASATQWEKVDGLNFNIDDLDAVVGNETVAMGENAGAATEYETGFAGEARDAGPGDGPVLDAIYGSYPELLEQMRTEVIIGADNRIRVNATRDYPWRAICALKITAANGARYIGTGWLVSARTVVTAGHCLYMHAAGGWVRSIEVIPGMNDALRPFGTFTGTTFRSTAGWVSSKNRNNDYGAIILPANSRPGATTGYFGFGTRSDAFLQASALNLSGYPGDKGGNQQWYMAQRPTGVSSRVITYNIDTFGGQSGAPVWVFQDGKRYGVGVHTNGALSGNSATRIESEVYNNILAWKNMGL